MEVNNNTSSNLYRPAASRPRQAAAYLDISVEPPWPSGAAWELVLACARRPPASFCMPWRTCSPSWIRRPYEGTNHRPGSSATSTRPPCPASSAARFASSCAGSLRWWHEQIGIRSNLLPRRERHQQIGPRCPVPVPGRWSMRGIADATKALDRGSERHPAGEQPSDASPGSLSGVRVAGTSKITKTTKHVIGS